VLRYGAHSVVTTRLVTTEHSLAHWWIVVFVWGLLDSLAVRIRKVMVEGGSHWLPLCRVIRRHDRHSESSGRFFLVGAWAELLKALNISNKYSIHARIYSIDILVFVFTKR